MQQNELYIGQYKNTKTAIHFNIVRYTTICIVLDYFCYFNSLANDIAVEKEYLINLVFKMTCFRKNKDNEVMIKTTISNMIMMGLLNTDNEMLYITDVGKQAYIDQKFHIQESSLYEAKETRRLSTIAIIIAITSIFVAIMPQIIDWLSIYFK